MKKKSVAELNKMLQEKRKSIQVVSESPNDRKMVICRCAKCNQIYERDRKGLFSKYSGCKVCKVLLVIKGYNDLLTLAPHLKKYLVNVEDGYSYTHSSEKEIETVCPDCGHTRKIMISNLYKRGFSCPCKGGFSFAVDGINDIATQSPWMVKYFVDKGITHKHTPFSKRVAKFKCPDCGTVIERKIINVRKNGFSCPKCGDGLSFPNKFGRFFITQTKAENIEFEFKREWTHGKFFDIYFEYKGKKYFIEMDSNIHFKDAFYTTYEEQKRNDEYKDNIAIEHGIEVIRIKCGESKVEDIIENIKKSILSEIFDLNIIDWKYCELRSRKSIFFEICMDYNRGDMFIREIAEKRLVCYKTACIYIQRGKRLGLCDCRRSTQSRAMMIKQQRSIS